jgi:hypothetical protein
MSLKHAEEIVFVDKSAEVVMDLFIVLGLVCDPDQRHVFFGFDGYKVGTFLKSD